MSTVGVDIGDWTFEKKMGPFRASHGSSSQHAFSDPHGLGQPAPNYGPVVFRTWDFGGQTEYYATHQYFLSKRSLYLVVWKVFLLMVPGNRLQLNWNEWLIISVSLVNQVFR